MTVSEPDEPNVSTLDNLPIISEDVARQAQRTITMHDGLIESDSSRLFEPVLGAIGAGMLSPPAEALRYE
jgi:hypothetical protein